MGRKKSKNSSLKTKTENNEEKRVIEGEHLNHMLQLIHRAIMSAKHEDGIGLGSSLPEKFWFKQQFSIGVNEVTRVLERMPLLSHSSPVVSSSNLKEGCVKLQAIVMAADCNPRWLTKHLVTLASSRKVPLIFIKDHKKGSSRLGQLVKVKFAMAIGIKAKENAINKAVKEIILSEEVNTVGDAP